MEIIINIKILVLEPAPTHDKKRRFTDFYFQRLRIENTGNKSAHPPEAPSPSRTVSSTTSRDYKALGIPTVKSTIPGAETSDFAKYKAAQKGRDDKDATKPAIQDAEYQSSSSFTNESSSPSIQRHVSARRFHLTRDLSSSLRPNLAGGIRRSKHYLRPPLATFIEQSSPRKGNTSSIHKKPPIDAIVELNDQIASASVDHQVLTEDSIVKRTQINTFQRPPSAAVRHGYSIRDDPATWDHDSDQLANELAALAFDIDPADATEPPQVIAATPSKKTGGELTDKDTVMEDDNDFVFETYIRVKYDADIQLTTPAHSSEIGVLVIDDENEDLWEKYVNSDNDDDEWDEEDDDSNGK